ncbi:MAG: type II toxin-antitoxin system HicA family toxin [Prosthecobacter sp.]|uniref:type II toxin-antitoxin system HicA family toxin n=1 Tax=Prosthecobacter sp. TaxID=1965333 RepID=UPI0039025377
MPRKIRQLISDLNRAGFELDRQKGSHRQFKHQVFPGIITLSGGEGDDAQRYQEKQIAQAIAQTLKK